MNTLVGGKHCMIQSEEVDTDTGPAFSILVQNWSSHTYTIVK